MEFVQPVPVMVTVFQTVTYVPNVVQLRMPVGVTSGTDATGTVNITLHVGKTRPVRRRHLSSRRSFQWSSPGTLVKRVGVTAFTVHRPVYRVLVGW